MKTGVRKYIAALSATALLTGCSSGFLEPVKKEVTDNQGKSTYAMDQLRRGNDLGSYQAQSPIKHVNNSWLPVSKIARQAPDEQYALNRNIVVNRYFEDMEDVAYYLTDLTGLVISLDTESRTAMATTTAEFTDPDPIHPKHKPHHPDFCHPAVCRLCIKGISEGFSTPLPRDIMFSGSGAMEG